MCLAVPLKIVEIDGLNAVGEVEGLRRRMRLDFIKEPKLGEYVIVHAGFAIERLPEQRRRELEYLRKIYPSLLITGPFSIVLGFTGGLMALGDRLKLRSMVVADKDDLTYIASEEAAIRRMEPDAENIRMPAGGEAVIIKLKEGTF